ncbi:MAG: YfiM family protein [Bacteroidia bacterium]|nr:YfiM family protein [Bacteroidia bacterium]
MLRLRLFFACFLIFLTFWVHAQSGINKFLKPSDSINKARFNSVVIAESSIAGLGLIGLNQLWYKDFDRSNFHTIDDGNEWMQMDKLGHLFSSYQLTRLGTESIRWSGADDKKSLIFGSALSLGFLTTVEIFDGFSEEWGFSWYDFAANVTGTGLYIGQELLWNEQRASIKFSFHQTRFSDQNPDKLGENFIQEIIKDYNGQTIWLSINLRSFLKESSIPSWLNLAFGYGAEGMLTGTNPDKEGIFIDQDRYAQWYLSLDLDLTRIKTKSHVLKTIFSVVNVIKIPLPTLEFSSRKKRHFYLFYL